MRNLKKTLLPMIFVSALLAVPTMALAQEHQDRATDAAESSRQYHLKPTVSSTSAILDSSTPKSCADSF